MATFKHKSVRNTELNQYYCSTISAKFLYKTNMVYLGSKFLKNFYTVIDIQKGRIGLAKKATQNCIPSLKITRLNVNEYFDYILVLVLAFL